MHSEIAAVPAERLRDGADAVAAVAVAAARDRAGRSTRKVDKLSCVRFGSARYSVPCRLIGRTVAITTTATMIMVVEPVTGEVLAEHTLVAPGETSIVDDHYGRPRPDRPRRAPRPRTQAEKDFCALGPVAEAFLLGAAAAGVTKLGGELADIVALKAAHGEPALLAALERAVTFRRWRAADVRSILAAGGTLRRPGRPETPLAEVLTLPPVPTRSLGRLQDHIGGAGPVTAPHRRRWPPTSTTG